ncbi:MAG: CoA-binding protein [Oligoflexia bacterium]|nr:CoA-binding protein [Oligoflexia bacterium]
MITNYEDIDFEMKEALTLYKKIAVVGLSPEPERPSFGVSRYMQNQGYQITPVRPGGEIILGVKAVDNLASVPGPVEIVDVFRKSEAVPQIVDEAIAVGAKVLWLQEGVTHPQAEEKARKAGLKVFSDLCILKEHARLIK